MKNIKDEAVRKEFLESKKNGSAALAFYGTNDLIDFDEYLRNSEYCSQSFEFGELYTCNIDDDECDFNSKEKFNVHRIPMLFLFHKNDILEITGTFSNEIFYHRTKKYFTGIKEMKFTEDPRFKESFIHGRIEEGT